MLKSEPGSIFNVLPDLLIEVRKNKLVISKSSEEGLSDYIMQCDHLDTYKKSLKTALSITSFIRNQKELYMKTMTFLKNRLTMCECPD